MYAILATNSLVKTPTQMLSFSSNLRVVKNKNVILPSVSLLYDVRLLHKLTFQMQFILMRIIKCRQ